MSLAYYWKSILTFLSLFATNLAADWMTNGQPIPENWGQLARWVLTIGAGTFLVYQKRNADPSVDEAPGRHAK